MKAVLMTVAIMLLVSSITFALTSDPGTTNIPVVAEEGKATPGDGASYYVTAATIGLSLALAALFGALAQSRAIAASVESIARQPEAGGRIFLSMIIGLALIETLVIYTLVICFLLMGKLA